jgi:hypothetical protein
MHCFQKLLRDFQILQNKQAYVILRPVVVIPNPCFTMEFVDNPKLTMSRVIGSLSVVSKDAVPDEPCDPRVEVVGDLKGKVEQVNLLDIELTDQVLFPQMNIDIFCSIAPNDLGGTQFVPRPKFINLFNSRIMNLRDLPMFGTIGKVSWCTKFLINRVHDRSL